MDEPEFQVNGFCMRLRSYQWGQFVVQSKLQMRAKQRERERPPSSHALAKKRDPLVLNPAERKRERERLRLSPSRERERLC